MNWTVIVLIIVVFLILIIGFLIYFNSSNKKKKVVDNVRELERIIEMALADGVLTNNEKN